MGESLNFVYSFFIGIALGVLFFAGLWWTLQKVVEAKSSPILILVSWLVRMSFALYGFYAVTVFFPGKNGLLLLLTAVTGFLVGRFGVNRFVHREGGHAFKS